MATILSFVAGVGGAAAIILTHFLEWLQTGTWPSLLLKDQALPFLAGTPLASWIANPNSWMGVHRLAMIALNLPLSFWILMAGTGISRIFMAIDETFD